jgi:hypothetical protein
MSTKSKTFKAMKTTILTLALFLSQMILYPQRVHLVSALGSDSSIYSQLTFDKSLQINHVEWLKPEKRESLEAYCDRLIEENDITSEDIVIGTSFGGIVATVISLKVHPKETILLSSISRRDEKPLNFKFMQVFRCHKVVPKFLLNKPSMVIGKCFGKVSDEERIVLCEMIRKNDVDLIAWSIDQIMKFDNMTDPPNLYKINGSQDKVFHIKYIDFDRILDGTHLMVYNMPEEVSAILDSLIMFPDLLVNISNQTE